MITFYTFGFLFILSYFRDISEYTEVEKKINDLKENGPGAIDNFVIQNIILTLFRLSWVILGIIYSKYWIFFTAMLIIPFFT